MPATPATTVPADTAGARLKGRIRPPASPSVAILACSTSSPDSSTLDSTAGDDAAVPVAVGVAGVAGTDGRCQDASSPEIAGSCRGMTGTAEASMNRG